LQLAVAGHPLHTRSLTLEVQPREDGRLLARGAILDLRKQGVLPMRGELQTAGIIHHMWLDLVLDPATRALLGVEAGQPAVAFEPSPETGGECCRDPIHRLRALVGDRIDAGFATRLRREIGGPRGCSHILTLFQLAASALSRALDLEEDSGAGPLRKAGESLFKRSLFLDGFVTADGGLEIAVQLSDFHTAPRARAARPDERLARWDEVRVLARADLERQRLSQVRAAERSRAAPELGPAPWLDRTPEVEDLAGLPLLSGLGSELLRRLGARPELRLLLEALLSLAPGFIQCVPPLLDYRFAAKGKPSPEQARALGIGGLPDSCYMWRRGGALDRETRPPPARPSS
jgi:hypothetical protein